MSTESTVGLGNGADTGSGTDVATTKKSTRGTVTSDPKLVSCIKITRQLDALTPVDREFVLDYIDGKYNGGSK